MKIRRSLVITPLILLALLTTTGMAFAVGVVNLGEDTGEEQSVPEAAVTSTAAGISLVPEANSLGLAATAAGLSLEADKLALKKQDHAYVVSAPLANNDDLTLKDLVQGAEIGFVCLKSESGMSISSVGEVIPNGCYKLKAFLVPERFSRKDIPIFDARVQFINSRTGDITAELEATEISVIDDPEAGKDIDDPEGGKDFGVNFDFSSQEIPNIFHVAPGGNIQALQAESCAGECIRRACGICSTEHNLVWNNTLKQCQNPRRSEAASLCVANEYSQCWEGSCNVAKKFITLTLGVTGLAGIGEKGLRVARFLF